MRPPAPGGPGPRGNPGPPGQTGTAGMLGPHGPRFSGFTVVKTANQVGTGVLTFDNVVSNVGGHYDATTHQFTCQIPGYYLFTFTIGAINSDNPHVTLVKNGVDIVSAYIHPPSGSAIAYRSTGSNTALLYLESGDQVRLEKKGGRIYATSSSPFNWNTFTGVLLHEI